jgi:predicted RNA binding protein YcfA (HicA-like mRNA interferase family)
MSKHQKALAKLCATPPPADLKWNELKAILEHLGYEMLKNTGSRRKFIHREKLAVISCHQPHPSPNVDKACVVDVAQHLRDYGFI